MKFIELLRRDYSGIAGSGIGLCTITSAALVGSVTMILLGISGLRQ